MKKEAKIVIAPKREFRQRVRADWQEVVAGVAGVHVLGSQAARMKVEAPHKALEEIQNRLGEDFYIEQAIEHYVKT
jgi:hypothetical protein